MGRCVVLRDSIDNQLYSDNVPLYMSFNIEVNHTICSEQALVSKLARYKASDEQKCHCESFRCIDANFICVDHLTGLNAV